VSLTRWAAGVWNQGEQWVLVAPPIAPQHPIPSAAITGPGLAVMGTSVSFQAHATEQGGSVTQYLWTFGDGGTATGPDVSHVFTSAEPQTVTMTATSSFGTVTTSTLNLAVVAPSAATASTPSNAVWYLTTPVKQLLFLPTAAGGLAVESWNGARWLEKAIPGRARAGSGLTALNYPDAGDVMEPHVFFRAADGDLAQTYRSGAGWATQTLAGRPAPGSGLVATTAAARAGGPPAPDVPEVFYFNHRGRLTQSYERGASWLAKTLPGPSATDFGSLALLDTAGDGHGATHIFYIDSHGTLIVTSSTGPGSPNAGWRSTPILPATGLSAGTRLAAISTGPDGDEQCVFFTGRDGKLAAVTSGPSSGAWTVSELPGTPAPATSLLAANYLLPSGALAADVFYQTASGQPAATSLTANTQQATMLPGTATAMLGASAYPAPDQPQRLFLANGTRITVDSAGVAGGPWTATKLPGAAANVP
jgi:PKD repeat protein